MFKRRVLAVLGAAVLAAGLATGITSTAVADPLSPQTGARITTSGTPTAGSGGSVYYVDSVNGSDSNNGLSSGPGGAWKTLARVTSATFVPGDVIAFKRGQTFSGSATIAESGSSSNYITVTAFGSGNQPVLTNPGGLNMLVLSGSYVRVSNVAFTTGAEFAVDFSPYNYENSGALLITSSASYADVQDSTFSDVGIGVKTYGLNGTILHNTFKDLRIAFRGMDDDFETSYGAIGVSVNRSYNRVAWNDFINCRSTNSPYGADGGAVEIEGQAYTKDNISIDHNYSRGSQGFLEVTETTTSNVTVSYNVSNDYQQFIAWDTTTTPSNYLALNNTVVRGAGGSTLFDQYYYAVPGPSPSAGWITIRNNIFVSSTSFSFYNFPHDHNLFSTGVSLGYALGAGDIVTDPGFVNLGTGDLRLTSTSPAIDNGATGSGVDLANATVNVGVGTDIGAFEYQTPPAGGASVVTDGGFETQTSVTTSSSPWYGEGTHSWGVDVNAGKARSGQDNGWTSTGGSGWGALKQTVSVSANSTYRLTVWVRNSSNLNVGYLGAKTTGGTVLNEVRYGSASAYTRYVVTFATGASTSVVIHVGYFGAGSATWEQIDDVSLQKL